jgi:hemoglobin/transferrin/lactoferrin receptor protein
LATATEVPASPPAEGQAADDAVLPDVEVIQYEPEEKAAPRPQNKRRPAGAKPAASRVAKPVQASNPPAAAQQDADPSTASAPSAPGEIDPSTSASTLSPSFNALSGSSTISGAQLNTQFVNGTLPQVLTSVPGVTTQTSADDPGVAINLRGLQDFGRVNVMVDGARQNFQKNGHEANGTFYLDTQMLKSVEVTRGPVAAAYGSGAIGGVVSFTTIDAGDVIKLGASFGGRVRTTYDTNGAGPTIHGAVGARLSAYSDILIAGTVQRIDDYESGGGEIINSAQAMNSGLAKWRVKLDDHAFTLSGSRYTNSFENGSVTIRESDVLTDTVSAGYRYTPADSRFWDLTLNTYYTGTLFEQDEPGGSGALEQSFDTQTIGLDLFNSSQLTTGDIRHQITYGGDVYQDRVETIDRFGGSDDLTPPGERLAYGSFIQDRLRYSTWLEVIGALRYDAYSMESDDSAVSGSRLSPKVTVGITPWEPMTVYATYAEGYRAPSLTETFIDGIHPPPAAGRFFPNPDLKPEIATTYEAGINLRFSDVATASDQWAAKIGVFENNVEDYIDQVFVMFPIPGGFQYQNIAEARIRGIEFEMNYDAGFMFASLSGQYLDGVNLETGEGLTKVPPWRAVATAGVRLLEEQLTIGARLTIVGEKTDDAAAGFVGEPYELVDSFAQYRFSETFQANLALNNIFNRDYIQYLNADPSPGFNAKASLAVNF